MGNKQYYYIKPTTQFKINCKKTIVTMEEILTYLVMINLPPVRRLFPQPTLQHLGSNNVWGYTSPPNQSSEEVEAPEP